MWFLRFRVDLWYIQLCHKTVCNQAEGSWNTHLFIALGQEKGSLHCIFFDGGEHFSAEPCDMVMVIAIPKCEASGWPRGPLSQQSPECGSLQALPSTRQLTASYWLKLVHLCGFCERPPRRVYPAQQTKIWSSGDAVPHCFLRFPCLTPLLFCPAASEWTLLLDNSSSHAFWLLLYNPYLRGKISVGWFELQVGNIFPPYCEFSTR